MRRLSRSIFSHFSAIHSKVCVEDGNCQKFTKNAYFGNSRPSTLTPVKSLSLLLVMISGMSVLICNRFHVKRHNCGKITTFQGVAVFDARLTSRTS